MSEPVHVVVVAHRTPELLGRALDAWAAEATAGRARVVVVETGGPSAEVDDLVARHPWAEARVTATNLGFGGAARLGARSARRAPWVLVANADALPRPGALAALLAAGEADPGAGVLAPRLVRPDGSAEHAVHPFPTLRLALGLGTGVLERSPDRARRWFLDGSRPAAAEPVPWVHGALLLVRGEVWRALGGYAPDLWLYAEDLDLAWRAARSGWRTRLVPEAVVEHVGGASAGPAWGSLATARQLAATYRWGARRRGRGRTFACAAVNVLSPRLRAVRGGPAAPALRGWSTAHAAGARAWLRGRADAAGPTAG